MASSKLPPSHDMNATSTFCPSARFPWSVLDESAMTCPLRTRSPLTTTGRWSMHVLWLERVNLRKRYVLRFLPCRMSTSLPVTLVTSPSASATSSCPESSAAADSIPVDTIGTSGSNNGTPCACILEPISARLASSCSRKGISDADMPTIWRGATSIKSISAGTAKTNLECALADARGFTNSALDFSGAFACAITYWSSASAERYVTSSDTKGIMGTITLPPSSSKRRCTRGITRVPAFAATRPVSGSCTTSRTTRPASPASFAANSFTTFLYGVSIKPKGFTLA